MRVLETDRKFYGAFMKYYHFFVLWDNFLDSIRIMMKLATLIGDWLSPKKIWFLAQLKTKKESFVNESMQHNRHFNCSQWWKLAPKKVFPVQYQSWKCLKMVFTLFHSFWNSPRKIFFTSFCKIREYQRLVQFSSYKNVVFLTLQKIFFAIDYMLHGFFTISDGKQLVDNLMLLLDMFETKIRLNVQ